MERYWFNLVKLTLGDIKSRSPQGKFLALDRYFFKFLSEINPNLAYWDKREFYVDRVDFVGWGVAAIPVIRFWLQSVFGKKQALNVHEDKL